VKNFFRHHIKLKAHLGPGYSMPNQIDLYSQDLQKITAKGDCYIIQVAGKSPFNTNDGHMMVIKKEELIGIYMQGEVVTFQFKSFPAILAKVSTANKKVVDHLGEFMKKHLINDTEEVDLLGTS
jgi:hypothetical protein